MTTSGEAKSAATLTGTHTIECDFCVVGTGAGGAMAAATLAAAGARVVMLEEGSHHSRRDFNMQESWAYPALYQDHGNRATDDLSIILLQGRSVGGGTTVNWGSSFRIPARTLALWQRRHGLEAITDEALRPHYEAVEERLNIKEGNPDDVNRNNQKLWDGCRAMGWRPELIRRSVKGCARLGYCGMGCPLDAKLSALVTYVRDALASGAQLYSDCKVVGLERGNKKGSSITKVHAVALAPVADKPARAQLVVQPRRGVILAAGALNTPALLIASQLAGAGSGVGTRTFLHPAVPMVGLFDEPIEGFYGPPQSVACHHFAERKGRVGYFLETAPVHPMLSAVAFPGFGPAHQDLARNLAHAQATIALLVDGHNADAGGTVSVSRQGRIELRYPLTTGLVEAARDALTNMAQMLFAAGAREVVTLHKEPLRLRAPRELRLLESRPFGAQLHTMFSAHQMGGAAMATSRRTGVVDERGRVFGQENLWIMDGSIFPTSLGVNPQLAIYALSRMLARQLV